MQNLEWSLYDKSNWTDGEWKNEPDKIQWLDEETGLPCLIRRTRHTGVLCGYVGLSENHPLYGNYDKWSEPLEIHGGINYGGTCCNDICHIVEEGEDDDIWWLGFSCNHANDFAPVDIAVKHGWICPPGLKEIEDRINSFFNKQYRNVAYVKEQCASLAKQLKELENNDFRSTSQQTTTTATS